VTDFGFAKIFAEGRDSLAHSIMLSRDELAGGSGNSDSKAQGLLGRCQTQMIGTPYYRAPEMIYCRPPYPTTYGAGVDVWAAGVVLHIVLSGSFPFRSEAEVPAPPIAQAPDGAAPFATESMASLGGDMLSQPEWSMVSDTAKSAVRDMLVSDPRQRPSAAQMLGHAWFQPASSMPPAGSDADKRFPSLPSNHAYVESIRSVVAISKRAREVEVAATDAMGGTGGSMCSVGSSSAFSDGDASSFKHRQLRKQQSRTHAADVSVLDVGVATETVGDQTSIEGTADEQQWDPLQPWANLPDSNPNYEPELWSELREALASVRGQLRQDAQR